MIEWLYFFGGLFVGANVMNALWVYWNRRLSNG